MIFLREQKQKLLALFSGWMLFLLFLALLPNSVCLKISPGKAWFTAAHYGSYFVAAYLLCLYLRFRRTVFSIRMGNWNLVWMVFVAVSVCSTATEGIQVFSDSRSVCWSDFFSNFEGGALGIAFFLTAKKLKEKFVLKKAVAEEPTYCPAPR